MKYSNKKKYVNKYKKAKNKIDANFYLIYNNIILILKNKEIH